VLSYPAPSLQEGPFITVTHAGTPGLAFVQTAACAVLETCLVLVPLPDARPKEEQLVDMFMAAALITSNSWRFDYSRTCSKERIAGISLDCIRSMSTANRAQLVARVRFWLGKIEEACQEYAPSAVPPETVAR
jgi:hypothetical protein